MSSVSLSDRHGHYAVPPAERRSVVADHHVLLSAWVTEIADGAAPAGGKVPFAQIYTVCTDIYIDADHSVDRRWVFGSRITRLTCEGKEVRRSVWSGIESMREREFRTPTLRIRSHQPV